VDLVRVRAEKKRVQSIFRLLTKKIVVGGTKPKPADACAQSKWAVIFQLWLSVRPSWLDRYETGQRVSQEIPRLGDIWQHWPAGRGQNGCDCGDPPGPQADEWGPTGIENHRAPGISIRGIRIDGSVKRHLATVNGPGIWDERHRPGNSQGRAGTPAGQRKNYVSTSILCLSAEPPGPDSSRNRVSPIGSSGRRSSLARRFLGKGVWGELGPAPGDPSKKAARAFTPRGLLTRLPFGRFRPAPIKPEWPRRLIGTTQKKLGIRRPRSGLRPGDSKGMVMAGAARLKIATLQSTDRIKCKIVAAKR